MNEFKFGQKSTQKLAGVEPEMAQLCKLALKYTTVDFGIIDGLRTTQEQQKLFLEEKTELDGLTSKSLHQLGLAVDVVPVITGNIWNVDLSNLTVQDDIVRAAWFEVYRAFMRAAMKLGFQLEFGVA